MSLAKRLVKLELERARGSELLAVVFDRMRSGTLPAQAWELIATAVLRRAVASPGLLAALCYTPNT